MQKDKIIFRFIASSFYSFDKLEKKTRKKMINFPFIVFRFMYKLKQETKNENQLAFYR